MTAERDALRALQLCRLEASGLPKTAVKTLHLSIGPDPLSDAQAPPNGFLIPYFDKCGAKTAFYRFRFLELQRDKPKQFTKIAKRLRYLQPPDTLNEIYMPPIAKRDWAKITGDVSEPLIITEGEMKAASVNYNTDYPCIGLGGVWCWRAKKLGLTMLQQLEDFKWAGREVYIIFDSDAVTNPDVRGAECELAKALTRRGAHVYVGRLPALDDEKTGIDDYIVKRGGEALNTILEEAAAWGDHEALLQLNTEVCYIENPSMVVRLHNALGEPDYLEMAPKKFVDEIYRPRKFLRIVDGPKGPKEEVMYTAKEWFEWPQRATYRKLTYLPGAARVLPDGSLNSWSKWGLKPARGDVTPWVQLLDHVFGADSEVRTWFEQWCAYPLQHPGAKMRSAVVIWGTQTGTGKSWIGEILSTIYGENATRINERQLLSSHNTWAYRRQFVTLDELNTEVGNMRQQASIGNTLLRLITEMTVTVNIKYIPEFEVPSACNFLFTANDPACVKVPENDRRYLIHEVATQDRLPEQLRASLEDWVAGGGASHLFQHLLELDLGELHESTIPPMTGAKQAMIDVSRTLIENWCVDARNDPDRFITDGATRVDWSLASLAEIVRMIDPEDKHRLAWNVVGPTLRRYGFKPVYEAQSLPTAAGSLRLWALRNVDELAQAGGRVLMDTYNQERRLVAKESVGGKVSKLRAKLRSRA